jgi:hypothetical protein
MVIVFVLGSFATGAYAAKFNVDANQNSVSGGNGYDTGIVVKPGQLLVFDAGKLDTWILGPGPRASNANGLGNPFGANFGNYTLPGTDFSFLYGALVGSLDGGKTFFPIGTKGEQSIIKGGWGRLRLYAWDSNAVDNSGSIEVHVEVYSGP